MALYLGSSKIAEGPMTEFYSIGETKTNEVWIDGKPIYRKVFQLSGITQTSYTLDISSLGYDNIFININKSFFRQGNYQINFNAYSSSTDYNRVYCDTTNGIIHLEFGSTYTMSKDLTLVLEYTKEGQ